MGQVPLQFDQVRGQFTLRAGIALGTPGASPRASLGRWVFIEFIFDTGSSRTAVSEDAAHRLGVDIDTLPLSDVGGITGLAKRPVIPEVDIWFLANDVEAVRLPAVTVLRVLREKRTEKRGGMRHQALLRLAAPCLLGIDAVEALGARVTLDLKAKKGAIEW